MCFSCVDLTHSALVFLTIIVFFDFCNNFFILYYTFYTFVDFLRITGVLKSQKKSFLLTFLPFFIAKLTFLIYDVVSVKGV